MIWFVLAALVAIAILPFLLERGRTPVRKLRKAEAKKPRQDATGRFLETGKTIKLSQGETWYRWYGTPTPNILVLVHGLSTPNWVFAGLVDGLTRQGYQVLVYDLYGRGLSDSPKAPQTAEFFNQQLEELLEALNVRGRVSLLGYSMGATIITTFANRNPARVVRMIYLAPAGVEYAPGKLLERSGRWSFFGTWLWGLLGGRSLRASAQRDANEPSVISDLHARMTQETNRRGFLRAILSAHRNTLLKDQEAKHRALGKTHIPVLAIWGGRDRVIPHTAMGKLTQWNRNVHHHTVEKATHALPHTAPGEILTAIRDFFLDTN